MAHLIQSPYIPYFVFSVLFLLIAPFSTDIATSVVPGWHTPILAPHSIAVIIVAIVLLLVTVAYWRLSKRKDRISYKLFITHLILTIPTVIYIRFPFVFQNYETTDPNELTQLVSLEIIIILAVYVLFIAGQVLFASYFIKNNWLRAREI
jgi:hypothetical protein